MNEITLNNPQTMTSVEIADLLNKEHKHVLRDIDEMLKAMPASSPNLDSLIKSSSYVDSRGIPQRMYSLTSKGAMWLVTKYDDAARLLILDKLEEQQKALAMPTNYRDALRKLIELDEHREELERKAIADKYLLESQDVLIEKSPIYYTVKQLRTLVSKPSGQVLARVSKAMGYEVKQVFSQYENIASNSYHAAVVNAVHGTDL